MPKKNAFWFYMRELMDEMRNDGVEVSSFAEMPAFAGPKWELMSPEQRRPYEEMVESGDSSVVNVRAAGKMNNMRELISEHAEKEQAKKDVKKRREQEVNTLRLNWPPGNDLIKERFQLIFFEYFVKTREDEYLPCEVALIELSLEEGIIQKYNSFIDPGPCPKGYMFEERLRSEQRHQIPCCDRYNIPQFTDKERGAFKEVDKILEALIAFNTGGGSAPRNNCVFTFGDDVEMVIGCLNYLYSKSRNRINFGPESLPRVLPLEHVLRQFYFHSDQVTGSPPSVSSFQRVLTQSVWDYESGIRCDFHDEVETRFCALSQVHRWSFAIFDAMKLPVRDDDDPTRPIKRTPDNQVQSVYDFTLTSKHLPAPTKASYVVLKPSNLPGRNLTKDSYSATASSLASSSRTDLRARSNAISNCLGFPSTDYRESGKYPSNSGSYQRPLLSSSPPPPPPGTRMQFGRGFGLKSRVSEVVGAKRSTPESPVNSSDGQVGGQRHRQERPPFSLGRGRGCVLKNQ